MVEAHPLSRVNVFGLKLPDAALLEILDEMTVKLLVDEGHLLQRIHLLEVVDLDRKAVAIVSSIAHSTSSPIRVVKGSQPLLLDHGSIQLHQSH